MIAYAIKKLYLRYPRYPGDGYHLSSISTLAYFIRAIFIESNYATL